VTTGKVDKASEAGTEGNEQQKCCHIRCGPICNLVARYRGMSTYEQLSIPLSALTLIAIIAAGVIYYCQLSAMWEATTAATQSSNAIATQAAIMQSQLEAGQRPRFSADASPIELGSTATEPLETTVGIVPLGGPQRQVTFTESNIGTGVAYRIRALTFWQEVPPDMVVVDLNVIHGEGTQLSGCTASIARVSDKLTCVAFVPVAAFEGVNPNSSLLFYGWIDYCDSLDIPRRDPICWRFYSWKAGGMQSECGSEVVNIPRPDEPCNTHR
jgi:hypothetical protein